MNELIYVFISLVSRLNGTLVKSEFKNSTLNIILNLPGGGINLVHT